MNVTPLSLVDTASDLQSTGVIMPHAIGDSMYLLVLLRNLLQRGDRITLIGGIIYPLRDWFPYANFKPDPATGQLTSALGGFDRLVQMFPRPIAGQLAAEHFSDDKLLSLIGLPAFRQRVHILASMLAIGRDEFGLVGSMMTDNGIVAPAHLVRAREPQRVIIHPVASNDFKAWRARGFVALARRLRQRGMTPCFVVPPAQAAQWRTLAPDIAVAALDDLSDLAALIYESGWFIGNDSGIGHLASALGLPTLSLFPRRGLARRWRPGWPNNVVVLPLPLLPTAKLKERFWRPLLPLWRVLRAFDRLQAMQAVKARDSTAPSLHPSR